MSFIEAILFLLGWVIIIVGGFIAVMAIDVAIYIICGWSFLIALDKWFYTNL